jgi:hypothetical protein
MNARQPLYGLKGGPLTQVLSVIVFAVLLVGAIVMGAVLLAGIVGVAVLAWIAFSVRLWWIKRKLRRSATASDRPDAATGRLIDAEYEVLDERDARHDDGDGDRR